MTTERLLTAEQAAIVATKANAVVVTAGAGSGKTEVVARRVERILSESPDELFRVLAVSYTVKASDEMEDRVRILIGDISRVTAETIHAFAHRLLRQHGTWEGLPAEPEVLDRIEDRVELLSAWLDGRGIRLSATDAKAALSEIDLARARCETVPYLADYRDALDRRGALDYAAMLEHATRLLQRSWVREEMAELYKHVIIDEAQNLTAAQYHFISELLGPPPSGTASMLVGDPKQSIVQFAGADPRFIERFAERYDAERRVLTTNFRSAGLIVDIADIISKQLGEQVESQASSLAPGLVDLETLANEETEGEATARWVTELLDKGLPAKALAEGEGCAVNPEDIAVLGRTTAALRRTASALDQHGIAYTLASDVRDWMSSNLGQCVVDFIAFCAGPSHASARKHLQASAGCAAEDLASSEVEGVSRLASLLDGPADPSLLFGSLPESLSDAEEGKNWFADREVLLSAWERFSERTSRGQLTYPNLQLHIARIQRGEPTAEGVRLLTVHKSQGREFRAVAVVGLNEGQFPDFRQQSQSERKAELHCFYVTVTRAGRVLRFSRARERPTRYGPRPTQPSSYLRLVESARQSAG